MRVWISTGAEGPQWAGRVECIQDGMQPKRFDDPELLLSYLRSALRKDAAPQEPDAASGVARDIAKQPCTGME